MSRAGAAGGPMPLLLETMEDARLIKAMLKQQGKGEGDVVALLQDMARVCELGGRHSSAAALRQVADEPWEELGAVGFFSAVPAHGPRLQ